MRFLGIILTIVLFTSVLECKNTTDGLDKEGRQGILDFVAGLVSIPVNLASEAIDIANDVTLGMLQYKLYNSVDVFLKASLK